MEALGGGSVHCLGGRRVWEFQLMSIMGTPGKTKVARNSASRETVPSQTWEEDVPEIQGAIMPNIPYGKLPSRPGARAPIRRRLSRRASCSTRTAPSTVGADAQLLGAVGNMAQRGPSSPASRPAVRSGSCAWPLLAAGAPGRTSRVLPWERVRGRYRVGRGGIEAVCRQCALPRRCFSEGHGSIICVVGGRARSAGTRRPWCRAMGSAGREVKLTADDSDNNRGSGSVERTWSGGAWSRGLVGPGDWAGTASDEGPSL